MKQPFIYSNDADGKPVPIFSQGDYDVFVGSLEENRLPMYVVQNRATKVVEFTSEVTLGYLGWLDSVSEAEEQRAKKLSPNKAEQIPLSFSKAN